MKRTKMPLARLMALCLTLVMALSFTTLGAGAATTPIVNGNETGSVTINGSANDNGATVTLYKIIDVNMDATAVQPKDPVYKWNSAVATWLEGNDTYKSYINAADDAVTQAYKDLSAKNLGIFLDALSKGVTLTPAKTAEISNGTATVSGLTMGQYLVIATKEGNTYSPATVTLYPEWDATSGTGSWVLNNATVTLKSKGDVEKTADDTDVNIGQTVTYTVTAAIPAYTNATGATAKAFDVGDTMGTGLTWSRGVTVYWSTTKDRYEKTDVVDDSYYTLATTDIDGATFEVQFKYTDLTTNYPAAEYVHVVYTASVNENAMTVINGKNTAYVGVNTNPYDSTSYEKDYDEEQVYTYGITVTKVDATNTQTKLPGAEFKLYSNQECTTEVKFNGANGVYTHNTTGTATLTTDTNGQIQLKGLATGTYYLKEVKAPGGYQLPDDEAAVTTITLTDTTGGDPSGANGVLDTTGTTTTTVTGTMVVTTDEATTISGNVISFQVKNEKPGFTLPTTGGMGTVAFTAGGLVIMACGAALVLLTVKKRKAED